MPARTRRRYTEDFKKEAVRLVRESAHPVARNLGIPDNVLYRWTAQHREAEASSATMTAPTKTSSWPSARTWPVPRRPSRPPRTAQATSASTAQ